MMIYTPCVIACVALTAIDFVELTRHRFDGLYIECDDVVLLCVWVCICSGLWFLLSLLAIGRPWLEWCRFSSRRIQPNLFIRNSSRWNLLKMCGWVVIGLSMWRFSGNIVHHMSNSVHAITMSNVCGVFSLSLSIFYFVIINFFLFMIQCSSVWASCLTSKQLRHIFV